MRCPTWLINHCACCGRAMAAPLSRGVLPQHPDLVSAWPPAGARQRPRGACPPRQPQACRANRPVGFRNSPWRWVIVLRPASCWLVWSLYGNNWKWSNPCQTSPIQQQDVDQDPLGAARMEQLRRSIERVDDLAAMGAFPIDELERRQQQMRDLEDSISSNSQREQASTQQISRINALTTTIQHRDISAPVAMHRGPQRSSR